MAYIPISSYWDLPIASTEMSDEWVTPTPPATGLESTSKVASGHPSGASPTPIICRCMICTTDIHQLTNSMLGFWPVCCKNLPSSDVGRRYIHKHFVL